MICHYWFCHDCVCIAFANLPRIELRQKRGKSVANMPLITILKNNNETTRWASAVISTFNDLPCSTRGDCNRSVNLNLIANWHRQTNVITSHLTTVICIHITFKWLLQHVIRCCCDWTVLFLSSIICDRCCCCLFSLYPYVCCCHSLFSLFGCIETEQYIYLHWHTKNEQ